MAKKSKKHKRHRLAIRKNFGVGAPPGSLVPERHGDPLPIRVLAYGPNHVVDEELASIADLAKYRGSQPVVWVNVDGVADSETVREIGAIFELHPLALEDAVHVGQRPKADDYDSHLFVVVQMPRLAETLELEQVGIFIGKGFVVSFQEKFGDCLNPVRERIQQGRGRIRRSGADYLGYALIDAIVDNYFPLLERYGEQLDTLEDHIMANNSADTNVEIHTLRQELHGLRRALWPLRETLGTLCRNDGEHFQQETQVFLGDCLDHTSQLMDVVEACREMSASLMDFYLSNLSHRMNEVMKVLTLIATVFIPLGFIASLFGMNFDRTSPWNMPELGWRFGYIFALGLMALTGIGFTIYFVRKGWIGRSRHR